MSLPTAVADVLWQISQSAAHSLVEKLEQTLISSEDPNSAIADRDPVVTTVQNHPSYRKAMVAYCQRYEKQEKQLSDDTQGNADVKFVGKIEQEELRYRYQQTQKILELLREWQSPKIQTQLEKLPQIWQQDAWFSQLSQQVTRQILRSHAAQHRLLILIAPLKISKTCPQTFHEDLTIQFSDQLERFFESHYSSIANSPISVPSPVDFYADYFPEPISKINVCMTHEIFAPIPTAIIYTNINDFQMNCHVGFWTPANSQVAFYPLPSWNWQEAKTTLETSGIDPAKVLTTIQEIVMTMHQVLTGFIADWYYLKINPLSDARLFKVHDYLKENGIKSHWIEPYISCLRKIQQENFSSIQAEIELELSQEKIKSFRCIRTLMGHSSWVDTLAIAQQGKTLVSGSYDNTIKLWDLSTGQSIHTLLGHGSTVHSVAISPDEKTVISGSDDGTIKLWNTATGQLICNLKDSPSQRDTATKVQSVAITQDGQKFVSAGDDLKLKIWQLDNGKLLHSLTGHSKKIEVVAIAPDDRTIVSGSDDGTIKVWDVETGQLIRTIHGNFSAIYALVISPNGESIISGHGQKQIKIWQLKTGQLIRTLNGHFGAVYALAISPDNKTLASADFLGESLGNQTVVIQLWDISTGKVLHTLPGHSNRIFSLCFSDDGETLVSASEDKTIKIWKCE